MGLSGASAHHRSVKMFFRRGNIYNRGKKDIYHYNISIVEMGSLWNGQINLDNASTLLDRDFVNRRGLDLLKQVFWVSVGQRTVKLQAVKVGDPKNPAASPESNHMRPSWVRVPDDGIMFKVWQATTLQPFDLQRLTIPLWKDLNLLNIQY